MNANQWIVFLYTVPGMPTRASLGMRLPAGENTTRLLDKLTYDDARALVTRVNLNLAKTGGTN